jgi:Methionine biosynthesis protein MetW
VTDDVATSAPKTDDPDTDDQAYLDRVRREIDEEVRRRRQAGDFPPSFERKLDELFARFTPTGTHDDHFTDALKLADRSAYFDAQVPFGSRRRPQGFTKWVLWQAEAWFVNYVVRQLNHFSASIMRVVHLLDERLAEVEREVDLLVTPALPDEDAVGAGADAAPFTKLLKARFTAAGAPDGRVLHAECGDGSLIEALADADLDVYGIDPGTAAADVAVKQGLDVRRDDVLGHLASVGDDRLAGLVLSGCVDRMTLSERRRLLRSAELKLAPGGTVAVLGVSPLAWEDRVGPVVADLAPGRPWHAHTWAYLLSQLGFTDVESVEGPKGEGLGRAAGDDPATAVLNNALERLEPLVSGPVTFCVIATKPQPESRATARSTGKPAAKSVPRSTAAKPAAKSAKSTAAKPTTQTSTKATTSSADDSTGATRGKGKATASGSTAGQ